MTNTINFLSNKNIEDDSKAPLSTKKIYAKVFGAIGPYLYSMIRADTNASMFLESLGFRGEKLKARYGGVEFLGNENIYENLRDGSIVFIVPIKN